LHFKVEPQLKEMLKKVAELEGVSVSAIVRRAVERLLEQYRHEVVRIQITKRLWWKVKEAARARNVSPSEIVSMAIKQILDKFRQAQT
jgi:Arc/MetJ-type ribon-helix-helix transcriptional regulator